MPLASMYGNDQLIQLPNGTLVPASGIVQTGSPAIAAANSSAQSGAIPANLAQLSAGRGGAAKGSDLSEALKPPSPPKLPSGEGGSDGLGSLISSIAKAAGSLGGGSNGAIPQAPAPATADVGAGALSGPIGDQIPTSDMPDAGPAASPRQPWDLPASPSSDGGIGAMADASGAKLADAIAPAPEAPRSGGILDDLKDFLHGGRTDSSSGAGAIPAAMTSQGGPSKSIDPQTGQVLTANAPINSGALPSTPAAAASSSSPDQKPDFFDRLQKNPVALALLTSGLATMAHSGDPGATAFGAIGKGALEGINAAFGEKASQKQEAIAAEERALQSKKADSESALQAAQAGEANANAGAIPLRAKADEDNASARLKEADAAIQRAERDGKPVFAAGPDGKGGMVQGMWTPSGVPGVPAQFIPGAVQNPKTTAGANGTALTRNAQFYVDNGAAPDIATAIKMLHTGVNDAATFQHLVQAEKKNLLATTEGLSMSDEELEKKAQANVKARAQSASEFSTQPTGSAGGAIPSNAGPAAAATGGALGINIGGAAPPAPATSPAASGGAIPPGAVQYLKQHPNTRGQFEQKFGPGSAAKVLGGN